MEVLQVLLEHATPNLGTKFTCDNNITVNNILKINNCFTNVQKQPFKDILIAQLQLRDQCILDLENNNYLIFEVFPTCNIVPNTFIEIYGQTYELFAAIQHHGEPIINPNGKNGEYNAYHYSCISKCEHIWYHFNDAHVNPIHLSTYSANYTGLFYQKLKIGSLSATLYKIYIQYHIQYPLWDKWEESSIGIFKLFKHLLCTFDNAHYVYYFKNIILLLQIKDLLQRKECCTILCQFLETQAKFLDIVDFDVLKDFLNILPYFFKTLIEALASTRLLTDYFILNNEINKLFTACDDLNKRLTTRLKHGVFNIISSYKENIVLWAKLKDIKYQSWFHFFKIQNIVEKYMEDKNNVIILLTKMTNLLQPEPNEKSLSSFSIGYPKKESPNSFLIEKCTPYGMSKIQFVFLTQKMMRKINDINEVISNFVKFQYPILANTDFCCLTNTKNPPGLDVHEIFFFFAMIVNILTIDNKSGFIVNWLNNMIIDDQTSILPGIVDRTNTSPTKIQFNKICAFYIFFICTSKLITTDDMKQFRKNIDIIDKLAVVAQTTTTDDSDNKKNENAIITQLQHTLNDEITRTSNETYYSLQLKRFLTYELQHKHVMFQNDALDLFNSDIIKSLQIGEKICVAILFDDDESSNEDEDFNVLVDTYTFINNIDEHLKKEIKTALNSSSSRSVVETKNLKFFIIKPTLVVDNTKYILSEKDVVSYGFYSIIPSNASMQIKRMWIMQMLHFARARENLDFYDNFYMFEEDKPIYISCVNDLVQLEHNA